MFDLFEQALADNAKLVWRPQRADLETIIADAWRWECRRP
jgi:UDP-glucose 4-epimerase